MLTKIVPQTVQKSHGQFAIVASKYNAKYVDGMLHAAQAVLVKASTEAPIIVRVPGGYEIPVVAAKLARKQTPALLGIVCLAVIIRGETVHAQLVAEAVTHGLTRIAIEHCIPVIHEVLLFENQEQAKVRCLSKENNRGTEAALTAVEMARVMHRLG
jgi:6,7-dimethyl-8-ribityllumazine synthase